MFFKRENTSSIRDDEQAWNLLKAGHTDALGYFYDKYIEDLLSYGIYLGLDKNEIKDSIHDVFVEIFKYRESISEIKNTKAYFISSFRKRIFREKKRLRVIHLDNNPDIIHKHAEAVETVEDKIIQQESQSQDFSHFHSALIGLTDYQAKVLDMKFKENKTYSEISEELNISIESVRTLIYRIVKKLRKAAIVFFF